jgi:hypothetical protein
MNIATVYFDWPGVTTYRKLLDVYLYSLSRHMADVPVDILMPGVLSNTLGRKAGLANNMQKMFAWQTYLARQPDGRQILMTDCDLLVLADIRDVWELYPDFDIAYTQTGRSRIPFSTGVMYIRNGPRVRRLFSLWIDVCLQMMHDDVFHNYWRYTKKYYGISQAALGYLMESHTLDVKFQPIPSKIYNCISRDLAYITDQTRVLHIHGKIQKKIIAPQLKGRTRYRKARALWQTYYRQSRKDSYGHRYTTWHEIRMGAL